jgi:hypothetical protein
MTSIRTALASALTIAALCTFGAYASHEAATQAAVSRPTAGPVPCCFAMTSQARTTTR